MIGLLNRRINYYIDGFCHTPEDEERTRDAFFSELNDIKIDTLYKSAQALISQIDNLNKDNNPLFALGVTASAQVLIDAARSI